ncbi:MAG: NADH-quinone oxidoreductase subunit C [Dehalococcoidia bacterium]|nr:NADH-quinone oxidoreductase subunit C [Dehalococcoidia bacterium]
MTKELDGLTAAEIVARSFPDGIVEVLASSIVIRTDLLAEVARYLHDTPGLSFNYLEGIASVDYIDYFEVVYNLVSLEENHSMVIKVQAYGREKPEVPSVVSIWKTADFQEREEYDLMGIVFTGHPNLKRIMLWEGFPGHPLRKDFLEFDHRNIAPAGD